MCTVTFIPRPNGYGLAMNRDESRDRIRARRPVARRTESCCAVFPSEPKGGTWIGLNDCGVTFALINWYSIPVRVQGVPVSRGEIIPRLIRAGTAEEAAGHSTSISLNRTNPFRVVGIFPASSEVLEWRWDLKKLELIRHGWCSGQWISSGFNEAAAQRLRSMAFRRALEHSSAGTLLWLRRLHRSHLPLPGPFSTCMHRADAVTVSYTEVSVSRRRGVMRYWDAAPCRPNASGSCIRLPRNRS